MTDEKIYFTACVICGKAWPCPEHAQERSRTLTDAQQAFDRRLKKGWTPQDWSKRAMWFSPAVQLLWEEEGTADDARAKHPDAVHVTESGCPKCLIGYADIMADPAFACDLCRGTGFPVYTLGRGATP